MACGAACNSLWLFLNSEVAHLAVIYWCFKQGSMFLPCSVCVITAVHHLLAKDKIHQIEKNAIFQLIKTCLGHHHCSNANGKGRLGASRVVQPLMAENGAVGY